MAVTLCIIDRKKREINFIHHPKMAKMADALNARGEARRESKDSRDGKR